MSKFDLKGIASALATAHNISEADAEKFLKVVCEVIVDALRHDGLVKIKGLGTFKLIGVPEREMVDVNSGERITVEARNRISFSPDAVLRDIINKPFVLFETVVLNDGVVFDDEADGDANEDDDEQFADDVVREEDSPMSESDEDDNIKEESAVPEENIDEQVVEEPTETPEPEEDSVDAPEETVEDESETEEYVENKEEEQSSDDAPVNIIPDTESSEEESVTDSDEQDTPRDSDTPQAVNDALKDARSIMDDIESGNLETEEDEDSDEDRGNFFSRNLLTIFIVLALIIGASAFVYGLYGNEIMTYLGYNDDPEEVQTADVVIPDTTVTAVADTLATESVKNDSIAKDTLTTEPAEEVIKKDSIDPDYYDSLDVRVRTGAYRIVGVYKTVVVVKGQTFKSITKAYLGEGMECYMEVLNGVKTVEPGDTLRIPDLKWRKKRKK